MKRVIALVVVLGLAATAYFFGKPLYDLHYSKINLSQDSLAFYIHSGSGMDELGLLLEEQDVIAKDKFLKFAEKLEFDDDNVEPGKYWLTKGMTVKSMIYGFKDGNQEVNDIRITFSNCKTIEEMACMVGPSIEADSAAIVNYLNDPKTIEKYGFRNETIIAMFLPDTYEIGEWDITAEEFVQFMADRYKEFWNDEGADRKAKLAKLGLQQSEVATLATIVMAEQGRFDQEWRTIAGLYLNRLHQGIKLQSDPTAKYCWGNQLDSVQRILYEHLEKDCPYNTYIHAGLPPGPLRMPSKKAIDAVLNAEDHNYIYMCARPDNSGLHNFAETLAQHNENARKFRKWMNERGL